jgi:putative endonuclease
MPLLPVRFFTSFGQQHRYFNGLWAEILCAAYLWLRGYRILRWRYKTKLGEIDLIAERANTIVFIEVKERANLEDALSAVQPHSQKRITMAAKAFLSQSPAFAGHDMRFDVMAVTFPCNVKHIKNAWGDLHS